MAAVVRFFVLNVVTGGCMVLSVVIYFKLLMLLIQVCSILHEQHPAAERWPAMISCSFTSCMQFTRAFVRSRLPASPQFLPTQPALFGVFSGNAQTTRPPARVEVFPKWATLPLFVN